MIRNDCEAMKFDVRTDVQACTYHVESLSFRYIVVSLDRSEGPREESNGLDRAVYLCFAQRCAQLTNIRVSLYCDVTAPER